MSDFAAATDSAVGLSTEEAAARQAAHGENVIASAPPTPLWRKVAAQFADPLVSLLLIAIVISLVAWGIEGFSGLPIDAIVIALIVVANAIIGLVQEAKAADAVAALSAMTAAESSVLRDGRTQVIPTKDLVVGDILLLAEGDAVGADGKLLASHELAIQESSLTGESEAVDKFPGEVPPDTPIGDRTNMVYSSTAVIRGTGTAEVTAIAMDTEIGAISTMLAQTTSEATPLQRELARVSKLLGIAVIAIAVLVMAALFLINDVQHVSEAVTILLLGVSMAVAAVPEGLPAILSIVLAIGVQAMANRNAVVKDLHSAETLGSASVIASDKTGTLTKNEMTVVAAHTASGAVTVTGEGYNPDGAIEFDAQAETAPETQADATTELSRMLRAGALANDATLTHTDGRWDITGDPTEAALLVAARKTLPGADPVDVTQWRRVNEVPFSSDRKMMSAVCESTTDGHFHVFTKGAPDVLIQHCTRIAVGSGSRVLDDDTRKELTQIVEKLSAKAYRTLAMAVSEPISAEQAAAGGEGLEENLIFLGTVGIIDPPRQEAKQAVAEAHRAGIRTVMITGDHPVTAAAIADQLGIAPGTAPGQLPKVLTGTDLDALADADWAQQVARVNVYARVAPAHKLRLIETMQAENQVVAMTGDGVNDAPALKTADIGIAMGITGTEVTKEAANMVLADDNYATIIAAVRRGRNIFANITKFLRYLLSSNIGEVITIFFGVVLAGFLGITGASTEAVVLPLVATQVLWINLITDTGPALAMGMDPDVDNSMSKAPRDINEPILNQRAWWDIVVMGIVMGAVTLFAMDLCLPGGLVGEFTLGGDRFGADSIETARTVALTTLVFCQLFNAFNARSYTASAFHSLFSNKWLWGAVVLGVLLQVALVYTPLLQTAFSTTPIDLIHWGVAVVLSSLTLWVQEIMKAVRRARS